MPPKPKYTKEEIVAAAFELTREKGIDAVVAREVGKRLDTSSSPIFTIWNSMDELRAEVRELAKEKYIQYMDGIFDYTPSFKEFGMRCVRFAADEPNLFRLLFLTKQEEHSPYTRFKQDFEGIFTSLMAEIENQFNLSKSQADELLSQMIIFANGIAAYMITDANSFSKESVSYRISQVCIGIVLTDKLRDGSMDLPTAEELINSHDFATLPQKKNI
ncbi:MAG: helix-turn-helix domain-containing protein [Acutalibacteraceae bacterium]|nr:helix-turn-helix domain-containing protein [Acutalibacteraceae bacterium]